MLCVCGWVGEVFVHRCVYTCRNQKMMSDMSCSIVLCLIVLIQCVSLNLNVGLQAGSPSNLPQKPLPYMWSTNICYHTQLFTWVLSERSMRKKDRYLLLYVWVLSSLHIQMCMQYPQQPKEGIKSLGNGVKGAWRPQWVLLTKPSFYARTASTLNH